MGYWIFIWSWIFIFIQWTGQSVLHDNTCWSEWLWFTCSDDHQRPFQVLQSCKRAGSLRRKGWCRTQPCDCVWEHRFESCLPAWGLGWCLYPGCSSSTTCQRCSVPCCAAESSRLQLWFPLGSGSKVVISSQITLLSLCWCVYGNYQSSKTLLTKKR